MQIHLQSNAAFSQNADNPPVAAFLGVKSRLFGGSGTMLHSAVRKGQTMQSATSVLIAQLAQRNNDIDAGGAGGLIGSLIYLVLLVVVIAGMWKMFVKAGKPGWGCIVPIYNLILLLEIAGRPIWWIILFIIPIVNFVVAIIVALDIAKSFGKSAAFGIGIFFLPFIFYPILGFGDARYQGPGAA